MRFDVSNVFCEVVSALGLLTTLMPIFYLLGWLEPTDVSVWLSALSGAEALTFLIGAYILGVFINVLGLPADEALLPRLGIRGQSPPQESSRLFHQKASPDLFATRTNAWVHYYCFRNLLLFFPAALIAWSWVIFKSHGAGWMGLFFLLMCLFGATLHKAVKLHAEYYEQVTRSFDPAGS